MRKFKIGIFVSICIIIIVVIAATMSGYFTGQDEVKMTPYHPFRSEEAKGRYLKLYDARAAKWPVASETRMVDTSYGKTYVRISGPSGAPPLVLLHGGGGNSLQWLPNIEALVDSFRVYAVDNIYDNGRSVYTRHLRSPDDLVKWLDEVVGALEPTRKISLMGVSYGGWLTSQYALRFPDRLDKIVLLAPAFTVLPLSKEWMARAILCLVPHRYFAKSFMYWLLEDLAKKDEASRQMLDEEVDFMYAALRSFKPKRMVNPTMLTDKELQNLKMPALVLIGEHDKIYSPSAQKAVERLHRVAPQIRSELIPDAGHDLTVVQAEMVNAKVLEFLKR